MSSRQFRHVGQTTVRQQIARGFLPPLEIEILKEHYSKFRWGKQEKELFLDLTTDVLEVSQGHMAVEILVRSLTQSRGVTVDYLSYEERFNVKKCILMIGDIARAPQPWAQLIQPAMYLFKEECNIFWIEVPSFGASEESWLKFGTGIFRGVLDFLNVDKVSVVACGSGGLLMMQVLAMSPELFNATHFVFNLDLPRTCRTLPIPMQELEELLLAENRQLWFAYCDEEEVFDRRKDGTPQKGYNAVVKLQARLEGLRRRGRQVRSYDDVLISDRLNFPKNENVERVQASKKNVLYKFSDALLSSIYDYLINQPTAKQDGVVHGLVNVYTALVAAADAKGSKVREIPELPAVRIQRLSPMMEERVTRAETNRKRLEKVQAVAALCFPSSQKPALSLPLPATPSAPPRGNTIADARLGTPVASSSSKTLAGSASEPVLPKSILKVLDDSLWEGAKAGPGSLVALIGSKDVRQTYHKLWAELHDL